MLRTGLAALPRLHSRLLTITSVHFIRAQSTSGSHQQPASEDALYISANPEPHYVASEVEVAHLAGKGRALVAHRRLGAGHRIMSVQPLAVLHGPCDEVPPADGLVPQLQQVLQEGGRRAAWLHLLHQGQQQQQQQHQQASRCQQLLHVDLNQAGHADDADSQGAPDIDAVITYNAFGDAYEDLAAFEVRTARAAADLGTTSSNAPGSVDTSNNTSSSSSSEAALSSHVGVWPHFSLLNHSCLPNCVHYVVGSTMVVRAVEEVAPGQELTISYLGREEFSPAAVRRALLQTRYGFTCSCPRCQLEQHLPPSTQQLLAEMHTHTQQRLEPDLMVAVQNQDTEALKQVGQHLVSWSVKLYDELLSLGQHLQSAVDASAQQQQLQDQQAGLQQAIAAVGGVEAALLCVEAAVYGFVELLMQHARLTHELEGQQVEAAASPEQQADPVASLQLCADIMRAVSKGSELHVFQACQLLELRGRSLGPQLAVGYAQAAEEALLARYGQVSPALMVELARHNTRIAHEFLG